jgi:phytoene dehydrogenase-like protein
MYDAAVIGAGFGGLGAALRLAERGARVVVFERLNYPGGCASTFQRDGYQFESGATLFSGFAAGQLFNRWIDRHRLDVTVDWLDPLVELRTPAFRLTVPRDRAALIEQFVRLPGCPVVALRKFFAAQRRIADVLWALLDDPGLLPPFDWRSLARHAGRLPQYVPLLGVVGRSLGDVLRAYGLDRFAPLRTYLDALCQITVQCSAAEAEAPFALATMDYYYRGTAHVRGGIGKLAWALVEAIRGLGGRVEMACRVRQVTRANGTWQLDTRGGVVRAHEVVANVLPQDLAALAPAAAGARLGRVTRDVEAGWGAAILYLVLGGASDDDAPHHLQLIQDAAAPLFEGNHLFCSVSGARDAGRAPAGHGTVTVSTHIPMAGLLQRSPDAQAEYIASVQDRMRAGIAAGIPEWNGRIVHALTASPRTFERFTGRRHGYVGGVPRRQGFRHYGSAFRGLVAPGLHLVGDSVFPGQSTLAVALGGVRVAEQIGLRAGTTQP